MTLTLAIGTYGGFYTTFTKRSWRICLGWIAITLYFYDFENAITRLKHEVYEVAWAEGRRAERTINASEHPEWEGKQTVAESACMPVFNPDLICPLQPR